MTKGSLETRTQEVRCFSLLSSSPRRWIGRENASSHLPAIYEIGEVGPGKVQLRSRTYRISSD
jgi:hypothetical protein